MILFPAIDILGGKSVRLLRGNFNEITVYGDPVEMAKKWASQGAEFLHIVDLDGAKTGDGINLGIIKKITAAVKIPVQLGGGIRNMEDISLRLEKTGVNRVIIGTALYQTPEIIDAAVAKYGSEKIVCGIDVKNGLIAIKGWQETADMTPATLGKIMYKKGVRYVVYTDISRDGVLSGVNAKASKEFSDVTGLNVIASGGVSSTDDLITLNKMNLYGAILGKAIYENKFSVTEALNSLKEK